MEKIRLDILVSRHCGISRHQCAKAIESNLVYVNNVLAGKKHGLNSIDSIIEVKEKTMEKPIINYLEVNENFIVLNKPEALCCARNINTKKNTYVLNELVQENYFLSEATRTEEFGLVHRLDKDTEGLMILSRNTEYYNILIDAFATGQVKKTYLAIVCIKDSSIDIKKEDTVTLNLFYGKDKVLVKDQSSIVSVTSYKIIKEYNVSSKKFAVVEIYPQTGRRHQIRVVLSHLKMSIVGDMLYGGHKFDRLCLYSSSVDLESLNIHYSLYSKHLHDINNLLMYLL